MKLNWFSPLPPAKTDIAHFTRRLLPALIKSGEVTLWTNQKSWDRELETLANVRSYRAERVPWAELNRAELTCYNIGNNPDFHGAIWQVSRQMAGVVILHDFRLHHFFDGLYRVQFRDLRSYLSLMTKYYGQDAYADALTCFRENGRNIDYMASRYPLTRLATERSLGVVVHSEESFLELQKELDSPLAYIPLPYPSMPRSGRREKRESDNKIRLVVFGYIARNRRLTSVLQAIAGLQDRDRFQLDVFGSILNDREELRSQVKTLGLSDRVKFHGFKPEADLDRELETCDLAINLRFPTMGEASGSQLRIWAHALPSLVSRVGWYSSLPDDTVAFVRVDEDEVGDIQQHLRSLISDPEKFRAMGDRGRRVLEERHTPEMYVTAFMELAVQAQRFRSTLASFELAERAARCLASLSPKYVDDSAFREMAIKIDSLGMGY